MSQSIEDRLILGHLTVLDQPPPSVLRIAQSLGFRKIGLRLLASRADALSYPLGKNPAMLSETLSIMKDTGITVFDVDVCKLTPQTELTSFEIFFETAAKLGATSVLVTCGDHERSRFLEKLAGFCDLAGRYGLTADLEFMLFTPMVPTLEVALDMIDAVDRPNLGVMVDTIHFDRTGASPEDLASIPRNRLNYVHLTDARAHRPTDLAELTEDSRAHRMVPGDGGLDLAGMLRNLPRDIPLCIEVSNAELDKSMSAPERARKALEGTRALLRQIA